MTQTDYILRMIEQLGQMLAALRKIILQQSAPAQVIADRLTAAASSGGFDLVFEKACPCIPCLSRRDYSWDSLRPPLGSVRSKRAS